MTINDSANLPDAGGSKTVEASDIDNPDTLNFWESDVDNDDDQTNPAQGGEGIADETDETGDENADQQTDGSADEENAENDDEAGNVSAEDAKIDETLVTLKGGEQVPVKELKLGYMRERDYRLKTQETANKGRELESLSNRVANTAHAFASFLAEQLPPEPSHALAIQDPASYTRQKAIFDNAMGRVNQILAMGAEPQQVVQQLTQEQKAAKLKEEDEALVKAFPQTATDEGREKFFEEAFDTARQLGFSDEEMADIPDHRYFKLAYYARLGLAAEQAKKKAMDKVNNAPPAVPQGKPQGSQQGRKNADAMARLSRTGSLKDAMAIDF
ncbi:hypothetical protein AB3480_06555 [Rhizobium mongolense]|uniref:hypothetical protein n=1 Tax=Rhizobium mongolense TaxID=57676 RepID=UPI0034A36D57